MKRLLFTVLIVGVLTPAVADAQYARSKKNPKRSTTRVVQIRHNDDCCWGNRFSLEPYAGAMKDAYDISPDDENTAYLVGFRVGYQLSRRSRLLGNVGYSKSDDVANPSGLADYYVYDNTWVFTTAGGEFDVVPGKTSASLGLQGGAAWRQVDVDGSQGSPVGTPLDDREFSAQEVLIPSLSLRHRLTSRMTVMAGLHDNIFDFLEGPAKHSLALTAGISFR
jgi:hypothetical protein